MVYTCMQIKKWIYNSTGERGERERRERREGREKGERGEREERERPGWGLVQGGAVGVAKLATDAIHHKHERKPNLACQTETETAKDRETERDRQKETERERRK